MLTMLGSWRRFLVLALVAVLTASLGAVTTRSAEAANTAPATVHIDSITSVLTEESTTAVSSTVPNAPPLASVPRVLAVVGTELTVTVSFFDSSGLVPAFFTKNTNLAVTSNKGSVTPIDTVALKGYSTAKLKVSMPASVNQVRLIVTLPGGKPPPSDRADDNQLFDVLSKFRPLDARTNFQEGIGGDDNCAQATPTTPVCGVVFLPTKASGLQVLLSLGPCAPVDPAALTYTDTYSRCGDPRGSVLQVLADLPLAADNLPAEEGYSRTSPATMIVKCDKTLCEGGSIQSKVLNFTLAGNEALEPVEPCPAKGVVGPAPQVACVDYVQSKRDGSGDTHLYLLFAKDARVSVG